VSGIDKDGDLVGRMGWASRMIMWDEEVYMSDEDGVRDEDGTGDDVNWNLGRWKSFVKVGGDCYLMSQ
jgi:hypothetical protein